MLLLLKSEKENTDVWEDVWEDVLEDVADAVEEYEEDTAAVEDSALSSEPCLGAAKAVDLIKASVKIG